MGETNEHILSRLRKLAELQEAGVETFAGAYEFEDNPVAILKEYGSATNDDLDSNPVSVSLAGRLVAFRRFGKAAFAHIQDSSGKIQIYLKKDILNEAYDTVRKLDVGDIIGVRGRLFVTRTGELTVEVARLRLLTKSLRPLPEKWHGLKDIELRYRQRYVDLIVNPAVKDTFRKRSAIIKALRTFLEERGYMEVETPMMQSIPGGGRRKAV